MQKNQSGVKSIVLRKKELEDEKEKRDEILKEIT
jgi:hypothetical protein